MKNKSDLFMTGVVFTCGLALLGGLIFAIVGNPLAQPHLRFTADFADITGIRVNSKVVFAGDRVGIVEKVEHLELADRTEPDAAVRLHLAIEKAIPIPKNVAVSLAAESMLGENQVSLSRTDPGKAGALLENGDHLVANSTGSMLETWVPGASDIIASIGEVVENLEALTGRFNDGEDGENLSGALADIRETTSAFKTTVNGDGEDPGLAKRLNHFSANLDELTADLKDLMNGSDDQPGLSERAEKITGNLESFSTGLNEMMEGSEDDPGLKEKVGEITDEIHVMLAGDGDQPGLRNRVDTIGEEIEILLAGEENDPGLRKKLLTTVENIDLLLLELKTLAVWGEYFAGAIAEKPNRLVFGKEAKIPTKEEILEYLEAGKPFPVEIDRKDDKPETRSRTSPLFRKR